MNRNPLKLVALIVLLTGGVCFCHARAQQPAPETKAPAPPAPAVVGSWTGDWGLYIPPSKTGEVPAAMKKYMYPEFSKPMDCKVEAQADGKWQAVFEGEAGKAYKYKIKMEGRQVGSVVMFQGTADLGDKDGGVFDWIGRATEKEFVGFFTSKGYTGVFRMARPR